MRKNISVNEERFDSTQDALAHKAIIERTLEKMIAELKLRAVNHDNSKLEEPEKSQNDYYIPMLQKVKFGTKEYTELNERRKKDVGLNHHFEVNRHHPEHFENGVKDMNLVDVMEMFCDWYSASLRSDSGFEEGSKYNKDRFGISDDLFNVMVNTYRDYFKG